MRKYYSAANKASIFIKNDKERCKIARKTTFDNNNNKVFHHIQSWKSYQKDISPSWEKNWFLGSM